jgi:predicted nucleic acid-binding protein
MRFVDTMIFIKWGQATPAEAFQTEEISLCGYILAKIRNGEEALISGLVKDEALIWFSRYKASRLSDFIRSLAALTNLKIVEPTLEDELEATRLYGRYPLGITDLINLSLMKRHGIHEIYSTDKGFEQVPAVKRVLEELKGESGYRDFIKRLKCSSKGIEQP